MQTRRQFLRTSAMVGAGAMLLRNRAWAFSQSPTGLKKWITPLNGLGPTGIPVATPNTTQFPGSDWYKLVGGPYKQQVHPNLPATTFYGYSDDRVGAPQRYLGGLIVAQRNRPVRITMRNNLPTPHILPVDKSSFFPDATANDNMMAVHMHGALAPWISDGGPFSWYTPGGTYGPDKNFPPDMQAVGITPPGSYSYYYPNNQQARLLWYHDHAHDLTRLNAYAGLATGLILRDNFENALIAARIIPGGAYEVPLVLQDKGFNADGSLFYPHIYEGPPTGQDLASMTYANLGTLTGRWDGATGVGVLPIPDPSCVPEAFFDTIIINGAVYPYLPVEQRRYRFRLLNGSQARFYNLQLVKDDGTAGGVTLAPLGTLLDPNLNPVLTPKNQPGPSMMQIGTEGGFLTKPVVLSNAPITYDAVTGNPVTYSLVIAPGERADVIIDFSAMPVGTKLILYNDAPGPFPGGDIRNDYYEGCPDLSVIGGSKPTAAGYGPNTRTMMQFQVKARVGAADPYNFAQTLALLNSALPGSGFVPLSPVAPNSPANFPIRQLTLNEDFDGFGRLTQRMGTMVATGLDTTVTPNVPTYGRNYADVATEIVKAGDTEIWEIYNTTADTHPIHFHLVDVQVLGRATFTTVGIPPADSQFRPPDANESAFKETVRMNPGEVIRVIMKFTLPVAPFTIPLSTRTGVAGHEYVYHCHILEHEEHDMMRPLIVTP